ncbi:MAG: hypothetical protein ACLSGB_10210 [Dorea sp.]
MAVPSLRGVSQLASGANQVADGS